MGTTSFRTADFNQKIERQLTLLSKFWEVHTDVVWSGNDEIQSLYYDFMKDNDFSYRRCTQQTQRCPGKKHRG